MKGCEKFQPILATYLPDSPAEDSDPGLGRHLESCPDCRAEAESYLRLGEDLKSLPLPDPGDLFFQAQFRKIQSQIQAESQGKASARKWWLPALSLAAAAVLLFIGVSKWQHRGTVSFPDWNTALQYLSEEGSGDPELGLGLEDLNHEQLDRLATNIERQIFWEDNGGDMNDEPGDLNDLSGPELDRLLQRLQTPTSRSNS